MSKGKPRPNLSLNDLEPFFQVLVFRKDKYTRKKLRTDIFKKISELNSKKKSAEIDWLSSTKKVLAIRVRFREFPSWLETTTSISTAKTSLLENIENAIILIDDSQTHVYVHSSNRKLEDIVKTIIYEDWDQDKLDIKKIYSALAEIDLSIKMLGINNTFGAGGTAAEAKSYSGKDPRLSLTPSFDSGYSFSYCLGAQIDAAGNKQAFGCSSKRRKFWGGWTEGFNDFSERCKNIEAALTSVNNGDFINTLVRPTSVKSPNKLKILSFYLDYVIPNKGVVILEINKIKITDWYCSILSNTRFTIGDGINSISIDITSITNDAITFSYTRAGEKASIIVAEDGSELSKRRRIDLIEFFKKEDTFTIIFEERLAFRENSFWKDNRLSTPFNKDVHTDISWTNVDLRKEDSASSIPGHISIADKTEEFLLNLALTENIIAIIKDGGANEISDHLVIYDDKIILIHEKFTTSQSPGLRIDDLQVVSAQLIKNIKYLFPSSHSVRSERLFANALYLDKSCSTKESLIEKITTALNNVEVQNECWIVQPGISKSKLLKLANNKAHVLLSHLASICTSNNTKFKLYCNL